MSGLSDDEVNAKLATIHTKYKLTYGQFWEELPEQKMAARYLTGKEKVLEIGGNLGRNTFVIAHIVGDDNLVTLESNPLFAAQLMVNRNMNGRHFHIEASALSARKLIQNHWTSQPSEVLQDDHQWVNTITWADLQKKYNIPFDTLVLDCEGAFYYILVDTPEILDNINLIIMENDFRTGEHKEYARNQFKERGFQSIYHERHPDINWHPDILDFFEVWKK